MPDLQYRVAPLELKRLDAATGSFEGLASTYSNVDLGNDVVMPGAFKEVVLTKSGEIRLLWSHDSRGLPIGKGRLADTAAGLLVKGQLNLAVSLARDVLPLLKDGTVDGLSIGYDILPGGYKIRADGVRELHALRLWETSFVTFGMNPAARIVSVKAGANYSSIGDWEQTLRQLGFSARVASRMASKCWPLMTATDEIPTPAELEQGARNIFPERR